MDLFNLLSSLANWIGWPVIVILLLLGGSLVFWIQQQRISVFEEKLKSVEQHSPDVLVKRLMSRHKALSEELERMENDENESNQIIQDLKLELKNVKDSLDESEKKIEEIFLSISHQLALPIRAISVHTSRLLENIPVDESTIGIVRFENNGKTPILTDSSTGVEWVGSECPGNPDDYDYDPDLDIWTAK